MNDNLKIRAFKDGKDFVVYFEDVSPDMESFLKNLFNPLIGSDSKLEQPQIEASDPVFPEGCGSYTGRRVSDILQKYGNKGYANVVYYKDTMKLFNTRDTLSVNEILEEYLFNTFSSIDPKEYAGGMSDEDADLWLKCFQNLVTSEMRDKVINITGFASYTDFLKDASLEQKVSLIYNVIMNMGYHR